MKTFIIGNSRERLMKAVSLLSSFLVREEDDYELILQKRVYKRSSEQNKRYWALLNELAPYEVDGKTFSAETWHIYFKGRFIGYEEIKLPNGKVLEQPISTTTLDKGSFGDYMTQIEAFAAGRGILLWDQAA